MLLAPGLTSMAAAASFVGMMREQIRYRKIERIRRSFSSGSRSSPRIPWWMQDSLTKSGPQEALDK
jgi:hypothetical protein